MNMENKDDQWEGPGIVQGKESKTLWISHNGSLKKVATCRVNPWVEEIDESSEESEDSMAEDSDEELTEGRKTIENVRLLEKDGSEDERHENEQNSCNTDEKLPEGRKILEIDSNDELPEERKHDEIDSTELIEQDRQSSIRPARGSTIQFRKLDGEEKAGKVKQVGKRNSKDKKCVLDRDK